MSETNGPEWSPMINRQQDGERLFYKGERIAEISQFDSEQESTWRCDLQEGLPDPDRLDGRKVDVCDPDGKFGTQEYDALKKDIDRWAQDIAVPYIQKHGTEQERYERATRIVQRPGPIPEQKPMPYETGRSIYRQMALKRGRGRDQDRDL
jgi:hypothetical protein